MMKISWLSLLIILKMEMNSITGHATEEVDLQDLFAECRTLLKDKQ